jgi:hypothetical protein
MDALPKRQVKNTAAMLQGLESGIGGPRISVSKPPVPPVEIRRPNISNHQHLRPTGDTDPELKESLSPTEIQVASFSYKPSGNLFK